MASPWCLRESGISGIDAESDQCFFVQLNPKAWSLRHSHVSVHGVDRVAKWPRLKVAVVALDRDFTAGRGRDVQGGQKPRTEIRRVRRKAHVVPACQRK